jgi:hypothetical protein
MWRDRRTMDVKRNGSQPSVKGSTKNFTGNVRIDPLFQAPGAGQFAGASVPGLSPHDRRLITVACLVAGATTTPSLRQPQPPQCDRRGDRRGARPPCPEPSLRCSSRGRETGNRPSDAREAEFSAPNQHMFNQDQTCTDRRALK